MAEVDAGAPAPVEQPVAAEVATPAPEVTATPGTEKPEGAEPTKAPEEKLLTQSEVNKLVQKRERIAESRALKIAREEAEHYRKLLAEQAKPAAEAPKGEPQYKDFEGRPEEYVRALIRYETEQREAVRAQETKAQTVQRAQAEESEYVLGKFAEAETAHPGLFDRMAALPDSDLTKPMVDFVTDAEHGFAVGDFLANNPKEAGRVAALSPVKQVLELQKIAQRLSAPPEITKQPSPIKPSGSTSAVEKPWDELTQKEFNERRARQIAQRR